VIVRIMGDGQYRLDDSLAPHLAELDAATEDAYAAGDQEALHAALASLAAAVKLNGERLPDDSLDESDSVVPPVDLTLGEAHKLMQGDGLVPDLNPGK
jgi:PspA-Associated protein